MLKLYKNDHAVKISVWNYSLVSSLLSMRKTPESEEVILYVNQ